MRIVSIILLLVSAFLSFKHGWDAFQPASKEQVKMMAELGITPAMTPYIGIFSILIGLMLLIPQTFFLSNVLNAITILLIMAISLDNGNYTVALIEIPFLSMSLLLIWLKYPFKF